MNRPDTPEEKRLRRIGEWKRSTRRCNKFLNLTLSNAERAHQAESVWNILSQTDEWKQARSVLLYHSLSDEIPTQTWIDRAVAEGKKVYLPHIEGEHMTLRHYNPEGKMSVGEYGISEPEGKDETLESAGIECVIVPGVAFDTEGGRLGRGKGYYDRLLQGYEGATIGVGYEHQRARKVETEDHDIRLGRVIFGTESHPETTA